MISIIIAKKYHRSKYCLQCAVVRSTNLYHKGCLRIQNIRHQTFFQAESLLLLSDHYKMLSFTSKCQGIVSYGNSMASFKHLHKDQVLWFACFCAACSFPAGVPPLMREHKIKGNSLHISPFQPTHRSKAVGSSQKMIHCYPHLSCILCDHIYHLYSKRLSGWKEPKRFDRHSVVEAFYTPFFSQKHNLIMICPIFSVGLRNNMTFVSYRKIKWKGAESWCGSLIMPPQSLFL